MEHCHREWQSVKRQLACAAMIVLCGAQAFAERLPARAYTTADGLGHDRVLCVVQD